MAGFFTCDFQRTLILRALLEARAAHRALTQEELSAENKMSVAAVAAVLQQLQAMGYPLTAQPHRGWELSEPLPDVWNVDEAAARLAREDSPGALTWQLHFADQIESTNNAAWEAARGGAPAGWACAAQTQTLGRGRQGRAWSSPQGSGLYVSWLVRPNWPLEELTRLTILAGLAAARAVETVAGFTPELKWPNDVQWRGKKLAGVLIEAQPLAGKLAAAVIGVGINVRQRAEDFAPEVRERAVSLAQAAPGRAVRRMELLAALLNAFNALWQKPFEQIRSEWESRCLHLGQRVQVHDASGRIVDGQAAGLDAHGRLLLRRENGLVETIAAGDLLAEC